MSHMQDHQKLIFLWEELNMLPGVVATKRITRNLMYLFVGCSGSAIDKVEAEVLKAFPSARRTSGFTTPHHVERTWRVNP